MAFARGIVKIKRMRSNLGLDALTAAGIDRLRPMWLALHRHHQTVAPHLGPFVSDDESWANRKRQYEKILAGEHFGHVASMDGSDIGYLLAARRPMDWTATFDRPAYLWELTTIIVLPAWRGNGAGLMLLDAWDEAVAASDTRARLIGVIPDNAKAVGLYTSRGFISTWVTLTRYQRPSIARKISSPPVRIDPVSESHVGTLKALWLSLHHHNQSCVPGPGFGPWANDEKSWQIARQHLATSARQGLLFLARDDSGPLGFASVDIHDMKEHPSWSDTLVTDREIAEIKSLVVDERARRQGIGSALLDEVDRHLANRGVRDQFAGAMASNREAMRLYQARGFQPTWLELTQS
jgi:ribosomal protein S18 acetylase RimI-like enzyme